MPVSSFTRGFNSFSGVDIKVTIGNKAIGEVQGVSYQVSREKAPIYTMGSADPRSFSRGKRAIAGSLVMIQFDSDPMLTNLADAQNNPLFFLSDTDDLRPEYDASSQIPVAGTTVTPVGTESANAPGAPVGQQESNVSTAGSDQVRAVPWYPDQIPPFDIVLTAANEYGALAIMKILGVELMNNGYGVSIDDIVSEHSFTYVATGIVPWTTQGIHPSMQSVNL